MRVLVACECSDRVRAAFAAMGHNAWSCDLKANMTGTNKHLQGDVRRWLKGIGGLPWDMLIAHPPCTHLCVSGALHFKDKIADGRQQEGIDFFMEFVNCDIPLKAIENPVGIMSTRYRKPDQIIQPYNFGDDVSKRTCLWLTGLPKLTPTKYIPAANC